MANHTTTHNGNQLKRDRLETKGRKGVKLKKSLISGITASRRASASCPQKRTNTTALPMHPSTCTAQPQKENTGKQEQPEQMG